MTDLDSRVRASPVLRRALVTLALGGATYALTELLVSDEGMQLLVTVFVGGATLLVQLLVEADRRLADLEERLYGLTVVTDLFARVDRSPISSEMVLDLVRKVAGIRNSQPLLRDFAETELERVSDLLGGLTEGQVNYSGEDRDWLLALTRHARVSMDAISTPQTDARPDSEFGFWSSDLGKHYVKAQVAVAKSVRIRRVFVLQEGTNAESAEFRPVWRQQVDLGIEVRWVDEGDLPSELRTVLVGLVLFDDVLSYESTPSQSRGPADRPTIVATQLILKPRHLESRRRLFDDVWRLSTPLLASDAAPAL